MKWRNAHNVQINSISTYIQRLHTECIQKKSRRKYELQLLGEILIYKKQQMKPNYYECGRKTSNT